MATTTNYGWTTPDDTALVKDGAAAIRTLGSSVDTTTKALNPSTTLGDIEYRSSTANTNTRLGIGTTGQVLTVAGGVPSWAAAAGGAGAMAQVATGTLSGTSVSLSSLSSYSELILKIDGVTWLTGASQLLFRINNNSTSNYSYHGWGLNQSPTYYPVSYNNTDTVFRFNKVNNQGNGNSDNNYIVKLTNCKTTGFTDVSILNAYTNSSSQVSLETWQGVFQVSAAVSSLDIFISNGYTFNSGAYTLWGA